MRRYLVIDAQQLLPADAQKQRAAEGERWAAKTFAWSNK